MSPGRKTRLRAPLVGLIALMIGGAAIGGARDETIPGSSAGSIEGETADELVVDYMRHVFSKLPRDWREPELEKLREEPPRISQGGVVQMLVPDGHIGFEYDAENRRLIADAKIHTFRDDEEFPRIGLSREEIHDALRVKAQDVSLGGGEIAYDEIADGFFLRRIYTEAPPRKQMFRELDRVMKTANEWFYEHYLEAVLAYIETMQPPDSAVAEIDGFEVSMVLVSDPGYANLWNVAPGSRMPRLVTRAEMEQGETFLVFLLFSGASADETGRCLVQGKVGATDPEGTPVAWNLAAKLWDHPSLVPPPDHVQMGVGNVTLRFDQTQPLGIYTITAEVCDAASGRCVKLEHPMRLLPSASD